MLMIVAVIFLTAIPSIKKKLIYLTNSLGYTATRDYYENFEANIHFKSTYSSDCILLQCGDQHILFDGGYYDLYPEIDDYFKQLGVSEFAAVINTHPDNDHIGALPMVLRDYKVDTLYCSPASENNDNTDNKLMLEAARISGTNVRFISAGEEFEIEGFNFQVISPDAFTDNSNSMSVVVKVTKDDFSAMFTGDSGKEDLMAAAANGYDLQADILKVPHHGSTTSTDEEIVDAINPQYAVITVNKNNHGHPAPEVVDVFEKKQIPLLLTESNGTIIISSNCDGEYIINSVDTGGQNEKTDS